MQNNSNRRATPRTPGKFIVCYRLIDSPNSEMDVSQTKNIGGGGMLLCTNKDLAVDAMLAIEVRLPFSQEPIHFIGKVLESKMMVDGLIYETRIQFQNMNQDQQNALSETLRHYLEKGGI